MVEQREWYWCLTHDRVEPRDGCKAADRLGPYPTEDAAANWRQTLDARNEQWDAEDQAWEEGEPPETPGGGAWASRNG